MKAVVFLGPSLDLAQARRILEADYRPPVEQGDVLRALADRPDAIAIIDGYFNTTPAVWHKEILEALALGVRVFGGGSMGALRAAELHPLGMRGVGQVFAWYRDGVLEADDEVAVLHGPAEFGYREISVAMVNMRDVVAAAERADALGAATASDLLRIAKEMFYADRTYPELFDRARARGVDPDALTRLAAFLDRYGPPLKQRDAIAVLETLKTEMSAPVPRDRPAPVSVEKTVFLEALRNEVRLSLAWDQRPSDSGVAASREHIVADARRRALLSVLATAESARLGIQITTEEIQEAADEFRRRAGLLLRDDMMAFLARADLTLDDFTERMRERIAIEKLDRRHAHELARRAADTIQLESALGDRDLDQ
jgi:hypothetical protein